MGKVFAVEYVTLDGVMENPAWSAPYFNKELQDFQADNFAESDALLLGRETYEAFKSVWPTMPDAPGAERINSMPKHVATTTLTEPEWNATFLRGDVAEAVTELKRTDVSLMICGSATLFNYLSDRGLIDEYRLMVYPVVVGSGKRLFTHAGDQQSLALTNSQITSSGVAVLTYTPGK